VIHFEKECCDFLSLDTSSNVWIQCSTELVIDVVFQWK